MGLGLQQLFTLILVGRLTLSDLNHRVVQVSAQLIFHRPLHLPQVLYQLRYGVIIELLGGVAPQGLLQHLVHFLVPALPGINIPGKQERHPGVVLFGFQFQGFQEKLFRFLQIFLLHIHLGGNKL
ncbi:hypothetical protein ES703_11803 [subsurface metagenome]